MVNRMVRNACAALGLAAALALPAVAGETAPKPKMSVTQITQDAAAVSVEDTVMISMIVIMAVTLIKTATGGAGDT